MTDDGDAPDTEMPLYFFYAHIVVAGYDVIRGLATSARHVVPGRGPVVMDRHPAASPGTAGWIVRLDADPTS